MGKRPRADSIGEEASSPKPKGAARGSPTGSAPSSSNFSVVPVEVIARMLEYLMETPALLPKRVVSKKWEQAMLCVVENVLCQRLTGSGEWKIVELAPLTKLICKAMSKMTVEVVSSIKVLDLSEVKLQRDETCDEFLECFSIPFVGPKSRSRKSTTAQGTSPSLNLSLVLGEVPFHPPKLLQTLKSVGSNLVGLNLNCDWTISTDENFVKEIAHLHGLKELTLSFCRGITEATVKKIAQLPQLRSLDVTARRFIFTGPRPIPVLTSINPLAARLTLEDLVLSEYTHITDAQVTKLVGALVRLKALDLSACNEITDKSCEAIARLPRLETLKLPPESYLTDASLKVLSSVGTLTHLIVSSLQVTDEGMKHVAKLTNLKVLHVSGCESVTNEGIEALETLRNLEAFRASETKLGDAGLQSLVQSCPKLSELHVDGCLQLSDVGVAALSRLHQLDVLCIDRTAVTDASLRLVATIPSLTALSVTECSAITNAGVAALAHSVALATLYLNYCNISDVSPLGKLSTLKVLLAANIKIRNGSLQALVAGCPKLEVLDLEGCVDITDRGASEISMLKKLVRLDLCGIPLTDKSLSKLASLTELQFLTLNCCDRLTDATFLALSTLPKLRYTSLQYVPITDVGALALAKIKTLMTIDLSRCEGVSKRAISKLEKQNIEVIDM
jgi:Leucine-rich repeat (LRR) protein